MHFTTEPVEAYPQELLDLARRFRNNHWWYDFEPYVGPAAWAAISADTSAGADITNPGFVAANTEPKKEDSEKEIPASEEDLRAFLADCGVLREAV